MSEPSAVVIAIGDEMISGARLDTNTQWLCQRLSELGVAVRATSTVGDDLDENVRVYQAAADRAEFVVSTGGLGPTADDLTRDVLAVVADKPLVLHEPSLRHIESLFAKRARTMPPRNRVQAMLPEGSFDIFNRHGTAPGIDLVIPRRDGRPCRIFALPGVPAEMKELFSGIVAPRIREAIAGDQTLIRTAVIKCFGLGESEMEARLGEMISRKSSPRVGITVSAATISLRICATGASEADCLDAIEQTRNVIHCKVGEYVFGEGEDFELQDAVAQLLSQRGEKVETIEVGHACPIAGWFADVEPAYVFVGGKMICRADRADAEIGATHPDEDRDWVLRVDGYPTLRAVGDIVADVNVTIGHKLSDWSTSKTFRFGGHPSIIHARIGKTALSCFRTHLLAVSTAPAAS